MDATALVARGAPVTGAHGEFSAEIEEIKTVRYVPLSHPFIERLIGTVRCELLDHVSF